jgi:hypothetical protein
MDKFEVLSEKMGEFMKVEELASLTADDGCGNSVKVTKDKHGFFKTKITCTKENGK